LGDRFSREKTGLKEVPRAYLVGRYEVLPEGDLLDKTVKASFDPRQEVLLEAPPSPVPAGEDPKGRVEVRDLSTDHMEIRAQCARPAILVISDNYGRGWKVEAVEGDAQKQYQVLPANGFQRAVPLTAGDHHFYLKYDPSAFEAGKWISILSWAVFLVLFPF